MKKFTLSFLAAAMALSPLPAFAHGSQFSSQKNTNEAVAVMTGNYIHQNTDKFDFNEYGVSATVETQASDPRFGALAPAVRGVTTDRATALDRDRLLISYRGHRCGSGRRDRQTKICK